MQLNNSFFKKYTMFQGRRNSGRAGGQLNVDANENV